jgi:hypothetical protein
MGTIRLALLLALGACSAQRTSAPASYNYSAAPVIIERQHVRDRAPPDTRAREELDRIDERVHALRDRIDER